MFGSRSPQIGQLEYPRQLLYAGQYRLLG